MSVINFGGVVWRALRPRLNFLPNFAPAGLSFSDVLRLVYRQRPIIFPRRIVTDTAQWASNASDKSGWYERRLSPWYEKIYDEKIYINPDVKPVKLSSGDGGDFHFKPIGIWTEPSAGLLSIRKGYVFSDSGAVVTFQNEILNEFSHLWETNASKSSLWNKPFATFAPVIKEFDGIAAVLAVPGNDSYYHWLLQAVPRLHLLGAFFPLVEKFIVPNTISERQIESLEYFGVPRDDLLRIGPREKILCSELLAPSLPSSEGGIQPWAIRFLNSAKRPDAGSQKKKLYLSRWPSKKRPVVNEMAVRKCVLEHGYEIIEGHSTTFKDQVSLFQEASHIIAPHGAALTNMIFSKKGARILEIFSPKVIIADCFYHLAAKCGHLYYCTVANQGADDGSMTIDVKILCTQIEAFES